MTRWLFLCVLSVAVAACGDDGGGAAGAAGSAGEGGGAGAGGSAGAAGAGGSAGTGGTAMAVDQCQNMADMDALDALGEMEVTDRIAACGTSAGGSGPATAMCLAGSQDMGGLGISMECANCFGNVVTCTVANCLMPPPEFSECNLIDRPPGSASETACQGCIDMFCTAGLDTCTGPLGDDG